MTAVIVKAIKKTNAKNNFNFKDVTLILHISFKILHKTILLSKNSIFN